MTLSGANGAFRQAAFAEVFGCELALDRRLTLEQPVHRRIQIIFIGRADTELLGECAPLAPAGGGELGVRGENLGGVQLCRANTPVGYSRFQSLSKSPT
jgi:hypothetical protein